MTNLERIIEAVEYAQSDDIKWFEVFNSTAEASKVLAAAKREAPDEEQIVLLTSLLDTDLFESHTAEEAYREALKSLNITRSE